MNEWLELGKQRRLPGLSSLDLLLSSTPHLKYSLWFPWGLLAPKSPKEKGKCRKGWCSHGYPLCTWPTSVLPLHPSPLYTSLALTNCSGLEVSPKVYAGDLIAAVVVWVFWEAVVVWVFWERFAWTTQVVTLINSTRMASRSGFTGGAFLTWENTKFVCFLSGFFFVKCSKEGLTRYWYLDFRFLSPKN